MIGRDIWSENWNNIGNGDNKLILGMLSIILYIYIKLYRIINKIENIKFFYFIKLFVERKGN